MLKYANNSLNIIILLIGFHLFSEIYSDDISGDITFNPNTDYFKLDTDNFDTNSNSIRCSYSSSTSSISWWKDNVEVSKSQSCSVYQTNGGIYFPKHVALTDSGEYSCKVNTSSNYGERDLLVCVIASSSTPSTSTVPECNPTSSPVTEHTSATNDLGKTTQTIPSTMGNSPNNAGPIAGAVVGVFVLIAIIGVIFYFFYKRQKTNKPTDKGNVEKAPVPNGTFNGTYEEVVLDNRKPVILPNNEYASIDGDGYVLAGDVAGFPVDNEQSKGEDMFYAELDKNKIPDESNYQQLNLQPVHNQADEADEPSSPGDKEASYAVLNQNSNVDDTEYQQLNLQSVHTQAEPENPDDEVLYNRLYKPDVQPTEVQAESKPVDLYTMVNKSKKSGDNNSFVENDE
uniref:uncharacterized protein LOC120341785 n=1 Tax=Styela clava TaxID=7725 RepID=UPI001939B9B8|nr:uncharacterized protein LOC120341785 [Styela clava]